MIERRVAFALLVLPFVWVAVEVLLSFPGSYPWGGQVVVGLSAAVCFTLALLAVEPRVGFGWPIAGGFLALCSLTALASWSGAHLGSLGPELATGVLLGVPWIVASYLARPRASLFARFVAYGGIVAWGMLLLAALEPLGASSASSAGSTFVSGFFTIAVQQGQVFGGLVNGAATPPLPVHDLFDPVFTALVGLSVLGLLLVTVRPQTGANRPLPVAVYSRRDPGPDRELTTSYGFSPAQQTTFRDRSVTEPPFLTWPPGLVPVFCGAAAASVFLVEAYLDPVWAVLITSLGVAVAVGALVVIVEWRRRLARDAPTPPTPTPVRTPTAPDVRQTRT